MTTDATGRAPRVTTATTVPNLGLSARLGRVTATPDLEPAAVLRDAIARKDPRAALLAADALARGDNRVAAQACLETAVAAFPDEPAFLTRLLELLLRWRDWPRFDPALAAGLARFPGSEELHFLGGRGHEERGRACAAIRAFGKASRLAPDDVEPVQRIARLLRARGRPFLARRRLRRALRRHPDTAALHAGLGYAYVDDGQHAKAVASLERAVRLDPDDSPYLDDLGGALLLAERWRDAAVVAVRSLKTRGGTEKAWTAFAVAHRHLGDLSRAERGYRSAVKAARDPSRAHGNLGLFLASRGVTSPVASEAAEHLRAALDAHPDWEEVREALTALEPA